MVNTKLQGNVKKAVEVEVIEMIQKREYNLNIVNNYGENLLHISAANGCYEIAKKILDQKKNCRVIDRKNKFGWTPLMQAIRNGNIDTVKLLLEKNSNINESTYLGMSVLGLAAAISKEMFETVYNVCPNMLTNAASDDISPLCVAAMKNDKELFFKLLELGMPLSNANEYTHIMMRQSTVPEIADLAKERLIIEDYWNETSDNIQVMGERDIIGETTNGTNKSNREWTADRPEAISKNDEARKRRPNKLNLLSIPEECEKRDIISPALSYNSSETFALSPAACSTKIQDLMQNALPEDRDADEGATRCGLEKDFATSECRLELPFVVIHRRSNAQLQPVDLDTTNSSDDLNSTLEFTPEFSPLRSPHVPPDINDENVYGENTPTPPRCGTPPKGMLLNSQQAKMIVVLRRFGLNQHIPVFLEQEVDIDLFLTLTNNDLTEIGIECEEDRCALLEAIKEYKRTLNLLNIQYS